MLVRALAGLLVGLFFFSFVSAAWSDPAPGWMATHDEVEQRAIVDSVYRNAPQGVVPYADEAAEIADEFRVQRSAALGEASTAATKELAEKEVRVAVRGRLLPSLVSALKQAGHVTRFGRLTPAGAVAAGLVYLVTGPVPKLLVYDPIEPPPDPDYANDASLQPLEQGDELWWLCRGDPDCFASAPQVAI